MSSPAIEDVNKSHELQVERQPTGKADHADAYDVEAADGDVKHASIPRDGRDPTLHPDHPINALGKWRKFGILMALSWAGFVANYSAASHLTAFVPMAKYFEVTVPDIANTIGYSLLGLAVGSLIWNPMSRTLGRRPTYLIGSLAFIPCAVWLAESKTYDSFAVARVFAGITSSWSQTVPPSTLADIYRKEVRGEKMAVYGLFVIIAPAFAPFFSGLMVQHHPWQDLYWLVLAFAGLQLILIFFLVPETQWVETGSHEDGRAGHAASLARKNGESIGMGESGAATPVHHEGVGIRAGRVGAAWMPWQRPGEYARITWSIVAMFRFIPVSLVSFYYGFLFATSVGITIVLPQVFEKPPYDFSATAVGASYLALGVGAILGKAFGGELGDKTMSYMQKRHGGHREPEYRLWALLPLLPFMFIGLIIVGVTLQHQLHWIGPLIGGAVFYLGIVAATGILQTYVVETYLSRAQEASSVFIFGKAMFGFVAPFYAYPWALKSGFLAAYAAQGAICAGLGVLICGGFIWKGYALRQAQGMPVNDRRT